MIIILSYKSIQKLGRMYVTAAPDVHKLPWLVSVFFILPCEMAEPWWICFFMYLFTDCCMQSWNATIFVFFCLFVVVGGGGFWVGFRTLNLTAAQVGTGQTISGTGQVRASILSLCRPLLCTDWCLSIKPRHLSTALRQLARFLFQAITQIFGSTWGFY